MKDFFISYSRADANWAQWVAWTLEEAGYSVIIQAWDFRPGANFVLDMAKAIEEANRTIAIISEHYLNAAFTQSEWAPAFARDPLSHERKLIPVRVADCKLPGLLSQIVYVDLVNMSADQARQALLGAVGEKRGKPAIPPNFPGDHDESAPRQAKFPGKPGPVKLFFSYAHRDEEMRDQLATHLSLLVRQGIVAEWHDRRIQAGSDFAAEIDRNLNESQIVLLLISADFLASDYCYGVEMASALERHEKGTAIVVPIILRPCDWQPAPFGRLQALPRDGKPITTWADRDEAFASIAASIRLACLDVTQSSYQRPQEPTGSSPQPAPSLIHRLVDVFKYPGVPSITFVEPEKFYLLKNSLRQPGLGVIIEGPSGIGKTTALRKAIEQLSTIDSVLKFDMVSARRPEDVERIRHIEQWHRDTLAVDDFHRLDDCMRLHVANYLKYLADCEAPAKLIVIGIPGTEKRLIEIAFDLGTRIRSFKLAKVSDAIILSMIEKGEKALNVTFDRKSEIALAAGGSLNIAQILCSNLVARAGIDETQRNTKIIHCDVESVVAEVMDQLTPKFSDVVRSFASLDGQYDVTCLGILEELAQSETGFLSLPRLKDKRSELASGIDRFTSEGYMSRLGERIPDYERFIYFDSQASTLTIDDPQLRFYLLRTPSSLIAREVGKR